MEFTELVLAKIIAHDDLKLFVENGLDIQNHHVLITEDSDNTIVSVFGELVNHFDLAQKLAKHYDTNVITYPPEEEAPYGQWILVEPDGSMYRVQEEYNAEPFAVQMSTKKPVQLPQPVA